MDNKTFPITPPPELFDQCGEVHLCEGLSVAIIRRALEQLDN